MKCINYFFPKFDNETDRFELQWKWNEPQKTQHLDGAATPLPFSGRTNNNNAGPEASEVGLNNNQTYFHRVAGQVK